MIPSPRQPADTEPDWALSAALAEQARGGDRDAFGELYRLHSAQVFRFAYYRLTTREQAEDIVAEAFIRALRSIDSFAWSAGGFIAWMITITRNLIYDLHKSSRHRFEISTGLMLDPGIEAGSEDVVIAAMASAEIHAAISDLNAHQRACIEARFLDQLNVAETADRLGSNPGAVRTLQSRAVRRLAADPRLTPENIA